MIQRYDFAPLDGITKVVFRRVWAAHFGGADRYFIPFFSPTDQHILTDRDRREIDPANNGGLPLVPQVMTCRAKDFLWAAEVLADMGYTEVNLNLGCPSGTVTAKGKGAGFLAKPEELDRFFDQVFSKVRMPVSVKTRLGIADPAVVLDKYPFELSGGEKRRVAIAGILALKPEVLVLDEPTVGLDAKGEKDLRSLLTSLHENGTSIILATHNRDIVLSYCDRAIVLNFGKIVKDSTPLELFRDEAFRNDSFLEPPKVFSFARELKKNGVDIDLNKIKDVSSLAEEIVRLKGGK